MPAVHRPRGTESHLYESFGGRPFRRSAALALGVTAGQLRAAESADRIVRLRTGVLVPARSLDGLDDEGVVRLRIEAATLAVGGSAASHDSGRRLLRLPDPVPRGQEDPWLVDVHLTTPAGRSRRGDRLIVRAGRLAPADVTRLAGIPATGLARTTADLCRALPLHQGLVVADAALRRLVDMGLDPWIDVREACGDAALVEAARRVLLACLDSMNGCPGVPAAEQTVRLAAAGAESPLESESRGRLLVAGLPEPECGVPLLGDDGRTYWVDLYWRAFDVVGEVDGAGKYDRLQALYREKQRQESLERRGRRVVRWTGEDLHRSPETVVERVTRALHERGWDGRAVPSSGRGGPARPRDPRDGRYCA